MKKKFKPDLLSHHMKDIDQDKIDKNKKIVDHIYEQVGNKPMYIEYTEFCSTLEITPANEDFYNEFYRRIHKA
jgi:hypothetical protein